MCVLHTSTNRASIIYYPVIDAIIVNPESGMLLLYQEKIIRRTSTKKAPTRESILKKTHT